MLARPNVSFQSLYGLVSSPLRPSTPNGDVPQTRLNNESRPSSQASTSDLDEDHVPLIRRNSHGTVKGNHHHEFQNHQQATIDNTQPLIRRGPAVVQEAELQLSTECPNCSTQVVIKVPRYMMQVLGSGKARLEQGMMAASTPGNTVGLHGQGPHPRWQQPPESTRDKVVRYSVRAATAFRESRVRLYSLNPPAQSCQLTSRRLISFRRSFWPSLGLRLP